MLKIALPKGRLLKGTRDLFRQARLELADYQEHSRSYRPYCPHFPELKIKVFQEKDIPIQVAVGNYDLGICGLDWVEELLVKYPSSAVVKVHNLGYGKCLLRLATSPATGISSLEDLKTRTETIRLAGEYPNLAEAVALSLRLRRFQIFPLWGAAEAYPPENAELVLIPQSYSDSPPAGLTWVGSLLQGGAILIANKMSWETRDMSFLLGPLSSLAGSTQEEVSQGSLSNREVIAEDAFDFTLPTKDDSLRIALPDGHQQSSVARLLKEAGVHVQGYEQGSRRPLLGWDGIVAKVIRPQDMPLQVANQNFALAITGKDWLWDHLCRFPTSPARELLDLGFGRVRIVAVVSEELPVYSAEDLRQWARRRDNVPLRVASEYVSLADNYARNHHLSPYRVIPTWGASEVFLPEDADLLIENTQTGRTLTQHRLRVIDTLFESSACVIGNAQAAFNNCQAERIASFLRTLEWAKGKFAQNGG